MKKLPIGIQTFEKIIESNYIYVDKTKIALNLIENEGYYFLSRPRRFGKSLFLSTLKAIFEGEKELFKDLYIYDKWDFNKIYPVIHISFGIGGVTNKADLKKDILRILKRNQEKLNIKCEELDSFNGCFEELIIKTYKKYNQKAVILIDEYDKPILDNITDVEIAKELRESLKSFYSVIKDSDEYIKFAFLTGVSKFSKVSLFSGLNNLEDITLHPNYSTICGYTQNDLETTFSKHLKDANMKEIKRWYNGYNFLGESVYNPFDILLFISKNFMFKSYWFETGTPTFLIELIKKQNYFLPNLADIEVDESILDSFEVENIKFETLLFQSGYLTIQKSSQDMFGSLKFKLKIPNFEVTYALNSAIVGRLTNQEVERIKYQSKIYKSLYELDLDTLRDTFETLFASIPYNNYAGNKIYEYEGFYASVVYGYLASVGLDIIAEDVTNRNRIDLTIKLNERVFIIEFKVVDKSSKINSALKQIKDKDYAKKYINERETYLVGIEFCKEEKNICSFEWERA